MIDEEGVVRHRHDHRLGLDYQSVDELKAALDTLPAPRLARARSVRAHAERRGGEIVLARGRSAAARAA